MDSKDKLITELHTQLIEKKLLRIESKEPFSSYRSRQF